MFAEERQKKIYEQILKNKRATLSELCEKFDVTSATIRTDLETLQSQGLIKRTHGGAILQSKTGYEIVPSERLEKKDEKERIAKAAASYVGDGDTIIVDQGTTCREMAKYLADKKDLTVIVNDLVLALELERMTDATVIMLGGIVRRKFSSVSGSMTLDSLNGIFVDKLFLGANAVSIRNGIATPNSGTADVKKGFVKISSEIFVLADSSKFERTSLYRVIECDRVNGIITDSGLSGEFLETFTSAGINVITV
ncbi:MAG: DeoR/GlpR transcriptional regulator [Clostridia bacterium]|nr:DeoR/GlpR transcriptional regulator [Clostridia bacterium]